MGENLLKGMDDADHIHFNLDGMIQPGVTVRDLYRWGSEGIGQGTITMWELYKVLSNRKLKAKTTFYHPGGKDIDMGGF